LKLATIKYAYLTFVPLLILQRIGTTLFGPNGIPTNIAQVAFNAQADAINAIKQNFPASGNPVGTSNTGCGGGESYQGN
jgi:hypothetical protein